MVPLKRATLLLFLDSVWGENQQRGTSMKHSFVRPTIPTATYYVATKPWIQEQQHSIPRGGGKKENEEVLIVTTRQNVQLKASQTVDSVKSVMKRWRKSQTLAILALRISFLVLAPISAALTVLGFALSVVLTFFRIITFDYFLTEEALLVYAVTRGLISISVASTVGFILPLFAVFGLVASLTAAGCEIAEPLLRIRYKRQLRKLRHLHKLLTDPVLMETMEGLLRGAQAVSIASQKATRRAVGAGRRKAGKIGAASRDLQTSSLELVETLLQASGAVALTERVEKRMPPSVVLWTRDQWASLRQSGILEAAATRALVALEQELQGAAAFLPYLEAIARVNAEQDQQKRQKRTKKRW